MKKRKYRSIIILTVCLALLLPSSALGREFTVTESGDGSGLLAEAAVVMDMDTGDVLYSKDMGGTQYPGGLTKLMTVLLLAENYNLEEKVSFSEILYDVEDEGLRLGLQPGEEITLYDAACAVMLGSANDVSNGIAEYVAGSPAAFAEQMNERAAQLGCTNTHFMNPHGLYNEEQYTCAYDLALIGRAAYENEVVREICGLTEYSIPATNLTDAPRQLQSNHQMLQNGSGYYRDWCVGGKESYTSQSLNTILTFGSSGGKNLVSVVMGVEDAGEAYAETDRLLSYGFENDAAPEEKTTEKEAADSSQEPADVQTPATEAGAENPVNPVQAGTEPGENPPEESKVDFVISMLKTHWNELRRIISAYAEDHFVEVFAFGCAFMALLFILIVLLLLRRITNSRIRRKRERSEKLQRERESQLENMTIEELEDELRRRTGQDGGGTDT